MSVHREKITTVHLRKHNEALILSAIYDHAPISRAELARLLNISRPTVTELTQHMLQRRLLQPIASEQGAVKVGKPPELLSLNHDAYHLLVADLSSEELVCALMNLDLDILQLERAPITPQPAAATVETLITLLQRLEKTASHPILGIAISTPGIIDSQRGVIYLASNLGWENVHLADAVAERFKYPVYIGNDANLAALGEYRFGLSEPVNNLVVLIAGVGVGVGIILNGELVGGRADGLSSLGHIPIADPSDLCTCGNFGCLETIVSEWGIARQAQRLAQQHPESRLNQPDLSAASVWRAAQEGDAPAQLLMRQVSEHFGRALAILINLVAPDRIVVTGSLAQLGAEFLQDVDQYSRRHSLARLANKVEIGTSALGDRINLIGAGVLLLEKELHLWNR